MSALALMAANENRWLSLERRRRRDHELAPHPGQRAGRLQGHRRPGAGRGRGRALGHRRRARLRPRQGRGAQDVPLDRPARVVRRRCTASTATWSPTPSSARQMGVAADHIIVCNDGDQLVLDDKGLKPQRRRCRPATSTSTASSATSAPACCATAGCWPTRAWWWSSSASTSRPAPSSSGPEIITRGWVHAPEAEDLLDQCAERVRDAVKEAFRERRHRHREHPAGRAPRRRPVRQRRRRSASR